ncbi:MAG: DNA cytosine methyltransferase [Epsilonproteobacteria bacterium]|nr:DNA cytosine methyltransferase [Campylobacterota bacterium]
MGNNTLKAIDFFCSGGGMTNGMRQAGIDVIAGIDFDPDVKMTYEENNPGSKFILADVFELETKELQNKYGLKKNDDKMVFIGCSPCQYWSIIRTNKEKSQKSKDLLKEFHRFVKYYNPGFVVVENVPGLERKSSESGLDDFVHDLEERGYVVKYDIYNLNEYGVPQTRKRFSLIASRVVDKKIFPDKSKEKPVVKDFIGEHNGFPKVKAGHTDNSQFMHTVSRLNDENLLAIKNTIPGGIPAKRRLKFKGSGFKDSYGRMEWGKPAPTITTKFFSLSNGRFGHPEEDRALSLREGATLQTFSKDYKFKAKSKAAIARMIGNAVPPEFARRIGEAIVKSSKDTDG